MEHLMVKYAIEVLDVRKTYRPRLGLRSRAVVEALKGVTVRVRKGTIHALLGPNGAGKTTLIKIVATLLAPDSGAVYVGGYDAVKEASRVREIIGVVLDVSKGFYGSLTGFQNLVFYGLLKGFSMEDAQKRAREVIELVGLDEQSAFKKPYYSYSLGMRAKLSLAKALYTDPEVLLLDEPTLGLDVPSAMEVRNMLVESARAGKTILVTGHNMREIEEIADEVTIINGGVVVAQGGIQDLKRSLGLVNILYLKLREEGSGKYLTRIESSLQVARTEVSRSSGEVAVKVYVRDPRDKIVETITRILSEDPRPLIDFSIAEPSLEDAYLAVVGGDQPRS
ncbi:ABC transporter ATP-binding protein [Thermogladius sp.]|uniref:ABC transporter ATP-binding protein n=1 Tax=Thermogladius sp. TaxID=2023064 RepID=UPI003D147AE9